MFDREAPKVPVPIATFPIASEAIQAIFTPLKEALKASPELKRKLFQVEFLSTQSGQVLVTLIYHRQLDEQWEQAAQLLSEQLNILLIGRSRGQKITLTQDWLEETLTVNKRAFKYKQPEQAFIQPNAYVNERMIEWAMHQISGSHSDLLELYCGIGNFTIPLSTQFQRVLATEVSKVATRAAVENLALNGVKNVEFARLSAEEMTIAMAGTRTFRRLASLETALEDYNLHTVFVDPPRAGLDSGTLNLVSGFEEILYISCNPMTLLDNLKMLIKTHSIESLAFFF
jgi:tRNA (uracil-5-)-methyltransferase